MKKNTFIRNLIIAIAMLFRRKVSQTGINAIIMLSISQSDITKHPKVVIKFPAGNQPGIILKAQGIHDKMKDSSWMTGITDLDQIMEAYQKDINTYASLEAAAESREGGAADARDSFSVVFITETSEALRVLVQGVVNKNKPNAIEVARSCNMEIQGFGGRSALEWSVAKGELDGSAELASSVKKYKTRKYCIQWQKTKTIEDAASWYKMENEITPTLQAKTMLYGLTLKDTIYFRYRVILKDGPTEWSEVIPYIVT